MSCRFMVFGVRLYAAFFVSGPGVVATGSKFITELYRVATAWSSDANDGKRRQAGALQNTQLPQAALTKRRPSWIPRRCAQLFFNSEQLIVFRDPIAS